MKRKIKAFTVIELLLVLAIITLLASIILTNLSTLRASAQRSAVLTEVSTLRSAIEECFLEQRVLACGGVKHNVASSGNCKARASARPVSQTAVCVDATGGTGSSAKLWPDVEKNSYVYAGYAGSDNIRGQYNFSLFRDRDNDEKPDNGRIICCTRVGCQEITADSGQACRTQAKITQED